MNHRLIPLIVLVVLALQGHAGNRLEERQRIIVTSDAEIDDECSLAHMLLYLNDFDCEAIVSSSSQYHAHDHNWAGDSWYVPYMEAYAEVYPQLIKHDKRYPTPEKVSRMFVMVINLIFAHWIGKICHKAHTHVEHQYASEG